MRDLLVVVLEVHRRQVRADLADVDRPGELVRAPSSSAARTSSPTRRRS